MHTVPPQIVVLTLALVLPLLLAIVFDAAVSLLLATIYFGPLAAQGSAPDADLVNAILIMLAAISGSLIRIIILPPKALDLRPTPKLLLMAAVWSAPLFILWWAILTWPGLVTSLPSLLFGF